MPSVPSFDVTGLMTQVGDAGNTRIDLRNMVAWVAPGADSAAKINATIARMAEVATADRKATVQLLRGVYTLEAKIAHANHVELRGVKGGTVLVPVYTGAADDPTNCAISAEGTIDLAKGNTTLSAAAPKGAVSLAVVSASGLLPGGYLALEGSNPGGEDLGGHSGGLLGEVVQIASTYVAGQLTVPLAWPLYQTHGTTGVTVKGVTPVVGAEVRELRIRGSQGGVTTAAGVYAKYAVDFEVNDLVAEGCSRGAIDVESSTWFRSEGFLSRGTNNCWYFLSSVCGFDVEDYDGVAGAARVHPSGLPRAQIYLRRRCTDGRIHDGRLVGGYAGFWHAGGQNLSFENIHIRDQEITQAIYDRAVAGGEYQNGGTWAVGWGSGHGPLEIAEFAIGCTYSNITTEDLRAPNAAGWNDSAPRRAVAAYIHDTLRVAVSNITCINWDGGSTVGGIVLSDVDGGCSNLLVRGHDIGLAVMNFNDDLKVNRYRFDAVRATVGNAPWPILLNYDASSNRGIKFDGVHVTNAFSFLRFGVSQTYDPNFEIRDLITDQGQWDYCILANNQSGTSFATGDVVEVDSAHTGTDLRVVTPNTGGTDYASRLAAIASGATEDLGTGFILIAPLPQNRASVKASTAAVAYGDRIGYVATRRAATAAGAAQPIGKALTRKAAGAEGMITIGAAA